MPDTSDTQQTLPKMKQENEDYYRVPARGTPGFWEKMPIVNPSVILPPEPSEPSLSPQGSDGVKMTKKEAGRSMITKYWKRIVVIVVAIALFSAPLYWVTYWLYFNTRYKVYTFGGDYPVSVVKYDTWTDRVKIERRWK